jgi:hypothetical protein
MESREILLTCMDWLNDETQMTQPYVFLVKGHYINQL